MTCQECGFTGALPRYACPSCKEIVVAGVPTIGEIEEAAARIKAANLAKLAAQTCVPTTDRGAKHRLPKSSRKGSTVGYVAN